MFFLWILCDFFLRQRTFYLETIFCKLLAVTLIDDGIFGFFMPKSFKMAYNFIIDPSNTLDHCASFFGI